MNHANSSVGKKPVDGLTIVPKVAIAIGICIPVVIGFITHLKGFYSWAELSGLAVIGVLAFVNYNNYMIELKHFETSPDTNSCMGQITWHFILCIASIIICETFVLLHAPPTLIMLFLTGVYFFYLLSNIAALRFMHKQRPTLSSTRMHDKFVNTVASLAYFLKTDNSLSYIGYLALTILCALVSLSSQTLQLLSPLEAAGLNAFAAGAAVFHLGISAIAFSNVFRTNGVPAGAAKAAQSDTIELTLFVVGPAKSIQSASERSDRACEVAEFLVKKKVFGLERTKVLIGSFILAAFVAFTVVVTPMVLAPSKRLQSEPAAAAAAPSKRGPM